MRSLAMLGLLFGVVILCFPSQAQSIDTSPTLWYLVEVSDVIAIGKLEVTPNPASTSDNFVQPLLATLDLQKVIKGVVTQERVVLHYQVVGGYEKFLEDKLRSLNGKDVVVFLTDGSGHDLYLDVFYGDDRVVEASEDIISKTNNMIGLENDVVSKIMKNQQVASKNAQVLQAINSLGSSDEEKKKQGRDRLIALGCAGVPGIVDQMQDDRLYHGELSFPNRAENSIEAVRQYHPKTIHEALSYILEYITGTSFRHSEFLNTKEEKDADYHGWLVYVAHESGALGPVSPDQLCVKNGNREK